MSDEYQPEDAGFFDYQLYRLGNYWLRGPEPRLLAGEYFSCIGASQAFGRYVDHPFPSLLASRLSLECLNFGIGGAGPSVFLDHQVLDAVNQSRFAIVQVLSGRSSSNTYFQAAGAALKVSRNGLYFGSAEEEAGVLSNGYNLGLISADPSGNLQVPVGTRMHAGHAYKLLVSSVGARYCEVLRQETKLRHALQMIALLRSIKVPKILLYFSEQVPTEFSRRYKNHQKFLGEFPHFVDPESIELMRPHADVYVECVSRRGKPHALPSGMAMRMPDGQMSPLKFNKYYPSPEMHEDVTALLLPAIQALGVTQEYV